MTTTPALELGPDRAATADAVIAAIAGDDASLRPDQTTAVAALCEPGARVLVVQATGWGKSAVYWAATAIRRSEGFGVTLVVSPLLSLMRDQVAAAARAGLRAATLNSANLDAWSAVESDLLAERLDVLLVSPERLANPGFGRRVLDRVAGRVGLLVIDEAHAVSDWGHDFRPDYRRVADVLRRLDPSAPVLATTATANARVTQDVAAQLGESTLVLRGPLARPSLQLAVVDALSPIDRYAWVVDALPTLPGSGIVYALTVADAERLTAAIRSVHGDAVPVAAYTGQLDGAERERLEDALRDNRLKALVATSALGMGYDKPDLGFVVHVGSPPSPVSYYQQVGRAGRGIDNAVVALLPSEADAGVWDYFATATIPDPRQIKRLLAGMRSLSGADPAARGGQGPDDPGLDDPGVDEPDLNELGAADAPGRRRAAAGRPSTVPALEAETGLRPGRVELMLKQLAVDGVVDRVEQGWVLTGVAYEHDQAHYDAIVATRRREADIMRDFVAGARCLMQLLQESLDDPSAAACGRCSVCLGHLPEPLQPAPSTETAAAVTRLLRSESHVLEPRKMWPGGVFGARGRIPPALGAEPGRVLIHYDAPEWRELLGQAFAADGPPPQELVDACVRVLAGWAREWRDRPEVVVALPAAGFRQLTAGVADALATVGRLGRAELTVQHPPALGSDLSSAAEAAGWRAALSLSEQDSQSLTDRVVLLVADASSTQWPVTVAAAHLRSNGAAAVLPLLLHRRP